MGDQCILIIVNIVVIQFGKYCWSKLIWNSKSSKQLKVFYFSQAFRLWVRDSQRIIFLNSDFWLFQQGGWGDSADQGMSSRRGDRVQRNKIKQWNWSLASYFWVPQGVEDTFRIQGPDRPSDRSINAGSSHLTEALHFTPAEEMIPELKLKRRFL